MPGVTITVTNRATGVARTAVTDAEGNFSVTSLVAGGYDVQAELAGFKTAVRQNVPVQTDTRVRVDFTLEVGDVGETVQVQAAADTRIMRTEDASLGAVMSESQVQGLPVKNRNFMALAQLVPGATESLEGNQNTLGRTQPLNLSVHGQRHFDNNIRLDGVSIISGFANGSTFIPSLESLKEVSVQTGQYGAAYGMYSGAQVDMVVKSGQNTPHGSGFIYHRGRLAERAPLLRQSASRRRSTSTSSAPRSAGRSSRTARSSSSATKARAAIARRPARRRPRPRRCGAATSRRCRPRFAIPTRSSRFPGNIIPANRLSPQAQALLQYIPLPTQAGLVQQLRRDLADRGDARTSTSAASITRCRSRRSLFGRVAVRKADDRHDPAESELQELRPAREPELRDRLHPRDVAALADRRARVSYVRESTPNQTGREGADIDPLRDFGIGGLNLDDPLLRGIPSAGITGYMGTGETFANPRLLYENPEVQVHTRART